MRAPTIASHFATLNGLVDAPQIADLDIAQIRCLLYLASVDRAPAGDVAASSGMPVTASVDRRIAELRKGGLIARNPNPDNLRIAWLSLTPNGKLVAAKLAELYRTPKLRGRPPGSKNKPRQEDEQPRDRLL